MPTKEEALMAQPLALSIGPRSRFLSLRHAMNMEGPEMTSMMAAMTSSTFQKDRAATPLATATRAWDR